MVRACVRHVVQRPMELLGCARAEFFESTSVCASRADLVHRDARVPQGSSAGLRDENSTVPTRLLASEDRIRGFIVAESSASHRYPARPASTHGASWVATDGPAERASRARPRTASVRAEGSSPDAPPASPADELAASECSADSTLPITKRCLGPRCSPRPVAGPVRWSDDPNPGHRLGCRSCAAPGRCPRCIGPPPSGTASARTQSSDARTSWRRAQRRTDDGSICSVATALLVMLMAGRVIRAQLPVERDVLLKQLRSSSWRDREAAVLALVGAYPSAANLSKQLDLQYVFLRLADRENEALWRRYMAGIDSETAGYGNYQPTRGRACLQIASTC